MRRGHRQKGFSLVELMVGVTIGLMAIYASYLIFDNVEKNYRSVETTNEAQIAGLYATFAIGQELSNAGAGVMSNFAQLEKCRGGAFSGFFTGTEAPPPLFPLPAAIIPDVGGLLDELFVFYGTGNFTDLPITVRSVSPFSLEAPLGLMSRNVLVSTRGTACAAFSAEGVTAPDPGNGRVTVTLGGVQSLAGAVAAGDSVIDLGRVVRRRFFVDGDGTLQMETWRVDPAAGNNNWTALRLGGAALARTAIASNVVAFKAQYGVAPTPNAAVNAWVAPNEGTLGGIIQDPPVISAQRIKAVRFGLIVRASEPDTALAGAGSAVPGCAAQWLCDVETLFDGAVSVSVPLPVSRIDEPFGYRYRKYETTVPLQNTIWNP